MVASVDCGIDNFFGFVLGSEILLPFAACKENSMLTEWGTIVDSPLDQKCTIFLSFTLRCSAAVLYEQHIVSKHTEKQSSSGLHTNKERSAILIYIP